MPFANAVVGAVLRSPVHGILSGSTDLVRFEGRRSGRTITTPTQYAEHGDGLVILVADPDAKSWWRNFHEERDVDVLVRGTWLPMVGRAVEGAREPEVAEPLVAAYLTRFPAVARRLDGSTTGERARRAVVVWCRPRPPT